MLRLIAAAYLIANTAYGQAPPASDFEIEVAYCYGADSWLLASLNGPMECYDVTPKVCAALQKEAVRSAGWLRDEDARLGAYVRSKKSQVPSKAEAISLGIQRGEADQTLIRSFPFPEQCKRSSDPTDCQLRYWRLNNREVAQAMERINRCDAVAKQLPF